MQQKMGYFESWVSFPAKLLDIFLGDKKICQFHLADLSLPGVCLQDANMCNCYCWALKYYEYLKKNTWV